MTFAGVMISTIAIVSSTLYLLALDFSHRQDVARRRKEAADAKENEKLRASVRAAAENLEVSIPDLDRLDYDDLVKWARKLEAQMIEETARLRAELSEPSTYVERQRWPVFASAVDYETERVIRLPREYPPYGPPPESGSTAQPSRGMIKPAAGNWYEDAVAHILSNRPIRKGSQ